MWRSNKEIDLHGLTVSEAISVTNDFLDYYEKKYQGTDVELVIITGAGHHSKDNIAKI